ncbi:MAG: adenine deaminase [Bacteroidales bacterium]
MHGDTFKLSGNIIDVVNRNIFPGTIVVNKGKIERVLYDTRVPDQYILPGLIDAHIHIESSMLIPSEFARLASLHGTVATVSDPHEIANVLGVEGVKFMIENGKKVPFKFFFGAPSCVPATEFETSGTSISADTIGEILDWDDIYYLSEMMNFPGVLYNDPEVKAKLLAAIKRKKPVDGHAPGLRGEDARKYAEAGITTDHECFTLEEAREKAMLGMKILIREGSAARNFDALIPLLKEMPHMIMFCSDDKHPDELIQGHINSLIVRAIENGYDMFDVISACTLNPVKHYGLPVGLLQPGDDADMIVVDSPENMKVMETYIKGIKVAENGNTRIDEVDEKPVNRFNARKIKPADIEVSDKGSKINIIEVIDDQIVTRHMIASPLVDNKLIVSDTKRDILKIIVLNRYNQSMPAIGFVHGFNLKHGAIASTVAHDSHNIIAVGTSDEAICKAVNHLIEAKGGIVAFNGSENFILPLPVAGLMSLENGYEVARKYKMLDKIAKESGTKLSSPFMTLSFLALLVIPELKLSDKGLFNGNAFEFISLYNYEA